MRKSCLKIFAFLIAFVFTQLIVLPWMSDNELLPLWVDILVMSGGLVLFVALVDRVTCKLWRENEFSE